MKPWLSALCSAFPESQVSIEPETLRAHAGDAWFAATDPEAVFFPRQAEDVAAVMKLAAEHQVPVTARGAGRGYVGGCVPRKGGIVVALQRLNRILEINREDGVGVVQPGVITGVFQDEVKKLGLYYPPDPASLAECSLGGNVATNAGGPRCLKYGVTRSYVLGLQVVLADGTLVRVGGRTHKNKTGFDLVGMFVGAEGMLGLVTEITLRLLPHPPARAALSATFADIKIAAAAVQSVFAHGFLPSAMELADRFTLEAARRHLGAGAVPPGEAHLLIELDGQPASVGSETQSVAELLRNCGALDLTLANTEAECDALWTLRRSLSGSLKATGLTKLNEDVTVPRSRLVDLFAFGEELQRRHGFAVACFGHAGDGNIHTNVMVDMTQPGTAEKTEVVLDELFQQVIAWGGSITGEHGIGLAKRRWWPQAVSPENLRLHQTLKNALDPQRLLNPDKFLG